jgi:1,4-dihydroxy-2-naphthoate octaprenyltransferase
MAFIRRLSPYVLHLRLPFQLTLAPIFLWGALLSGGRWDSGTTAAFVAIHLFLYPAATAFNSFYDRDAGPVGGLKEPPEVPAGLLGFAVALAASGGLAALTAGWPFAFVYALIVVWTGAYSHPRTRWKASPWKSAAAIALGQGALGLLAGWVATSGGGAPPEALIAGALGAALTALGLYPVTQVFQVEEDKSRGDRTLAVVLGEKRALRFGSLCLAVAAAVTAWLVSRMFGPSDSALIVLGYAALMLMAERLAGRPNYGHAMRLLNIATFGFLIFIAIEAVGRG